MNQHAVTTSGCSFVNSHVCNRAVTCNNEKEFMDVAECIPIAIHVQCVMKVCACCPDRVGNRSGVLGQCHSQGASIHDLYSGIQSSASSCVWTGPRILVFHVRFYLCLSHQASLNTHACQYQSLTILPGHKCLL